MSITRFLAGFAIGATLGAVAGLLLAPKSGEETRAWRNGFRFSKKN